MTMRAYKLRLYPTRKQEHALARWFGHARWTWNWALKARTKAYRRRGDTLTSVDLGRILTRVKRSKSRSWLAEVPRDCLDQKLRDLDAAYGNFFAGRGRFPRFKSREHAQSTRIKFDQRHASKARAWLAGTLALPKLGAVNLRGRTLPKAMPKLVTVSRDSCDRHWVSFVVDETIAPIAPPVNASVGGDLGIAHLATLSTGEHIENPRALQRHLEKLKRLQQRLARQCRGSKRRRRTRTRIARVHAKIRNTRYDAIHKLTTRLVHENQVIAIEDLGVDAMARSAKGTREAPGKNVRAKSGLNRSLKDAAFGEFRRHPGRSATHRGGAPSGAHRRPGAEISPVGGVARVPTHIHTMSSGAFCAVALRIPGWRLDRHPCLSRRKSRAKREHESRSANSHNTYSRLGVVAHRP